MINRRTVLVVLGLLISVGAIWFVISKVDLHSVGRELSHIGIVLSLGIAALYCIGFAPRTLRSVQMAKPFAPMPAKTALEAVVLGYTANNLLPLRLGEVVRTLFVSHRIGISRTSSLALVASERLLDALGLAVVLLTSLLLLAHGGSHLPEDLQRFVVPCAVLVGLGLVGVALVAVLGPKLQPWVSRLRKPALDAVFSRLLEATAFTRSPKLLLSVSLLTFCVWLCEGTVFCATAAALDVPHPLLAGFLTLSFVNLGVLIPSSPGYIGVFHAAAVIALTPLGVPASTALAMAILCHAIPFLTVTSAGLVIFARHSKEVLADLRETRNS